jgi:predicted transcriptional regulator
LQLGIVASITFPDAARILSGERKSKMKKLVMILALVLVAATSFAGDGKSCGKADVKTVELTGTIECADGDCSKAVLVSNDQRYSICDKSKVKLTSLNGNRVKVTGKVMKCDDAEELVVTKLAKI